MFSVASPPSLQTRSAASRYGPAALACAAAMAAFIMLAPAWGSVTLVSAFLVVVVFSAWRGGFGPGLLATAVTTLAGALSIPPNAPYPEQDALHLVVYFTIGTAISAMAGALQGALLRERGQRRALTISEERLRLTVNATQDAIWDWDVIAGTLEWNPAVTTLFGWEADSCTGPTWWQERIHPEDREAVVRSLRAVVADPQISHWESEYRFMRADGSVAEVFDRGSVLRDDQGRGTRMIGAMMDQTNRRQAERDSRRHRAEVQAIIDTVPSLISYVDRHYIYRWNSRAYERWFHRPLTEIVGRSMPELMGEAAFSRTKPMVDLALAGKQSEFEGFVPYEGTEPRWIHAVYAPHRAADGTIDGVAVSVTDITERKQAEVARSTLAAIVENSDDAIVSMSLAGVVTSWNRAAERLFGYTAEEMIGASITRLIPPERSAEAEDILAAFSEGRTLKHYESQRLAKDGRLIDVEVTTSPIHDSAKAVVGASKILRDITERRRAQDSLRDSETRWRQLAEAMPHLVWTCRADGSCDYLSKQWAEYTGVSEDALPCPAWIDVVHPGDRPRVSAEWEQAIRDVSVLDSEFRIRRHDGEYRWFKTRAEPARDAAGEIVKWFGTHTDIEDLKRAEAAAISEVEQRRLALAAAGMGTWTWEIPADVIEWSSRSYELFGVSPDRPLVYERFIETVHPDDRELVNEKVAACFASTDGTYQAEYRVVLPDGSTRWLFAKGALERDPLTAQPAKMVGVLMDVTDRVLASERLAAALNSAESANRAKDSFLAALSHELRTPLTPVLFLAATQERSAEVPPTLREDFAMIRRNIELEARLIDDLLDLTRITRGKLQLDLEPTDLHSVLQRSVELLANDIASRRIDLTLELAAPQHAALADSVRLQQVFWNVLKNAVKFTPERGRIEVRTSAGDGQWRVAVRDSGLGITEDELPRIFEAFAQGQEASSHRFGGLGLGLAISKLLVREQRGRIWAESAGRDRGTTFFIELPLLAAESSALTEKPLQESEIKGGAQRLLVVEDHAQTRQTLERLLSRRGYAVATAETATAARKLVAGNTFDLMISDVGLPDGTGHELAAEFAQHYSLRAIALTGYGMEEDVRRSIEAGFLDHITKPVDIEALHDAIVQALRD